MKKRILSSVIIAAIIAVNMSITAMASGSAYVFLDGEQVLFDQAPVVENGRTLVPFRAIFEAMGADISWDEETKTIEATNGDTTLKLSVGSNTMYVNDKAVELEAAPKIIGDRTMVPVRAISEGFDSEVSWDADTKTVYIKTVETEDDVTGIAEDDTEKKSGAIAVEKKNKSFEIKADDGTVVMEYSIDYPQFEGLDNVNKRLEELAQEFIDKNSESEYTENAKEVYAEIETAAIPYGYEYTYEITRNDGEIICILNTGLLNMGGAHPSSDRSVDIIEVSTGEVVHAEELLDMTAEELDKTVKDGYIEMIKENPEMFYEDALVKLEEEFNSIGYYCNDEGVVFYMPQYAIAPYAAGFIEYTIPYKK